MALKYLLGSGEPANEGTFRPLRLILPEGTLLSASPTAPIGNYNRAFPTVIDCGTSISDASVLVAVTTPSGTKRGATTSISSPAAVGAENAGIELVRRHLVRPSTPA